MVKKFENFNKLGTSDDFELGKKSVLLSIDNLIEEYTDFINDISPTHWRMIGNHFTNLNKMKEDIERFNSISEKEKENDWVKEQRFKK